MIGSRRQRRPPNSLGLVLVEKAQGAQVLPRDVGTNKASFYGRPCARSVGSSLCHETAFIDTASHVHPQCVYVQRLWDVCVFGMYTCCVGTK